MPAVTLGDTIVQLREEFVDLDGLRIGDAATRLRGDRREYFTATNSEIYNEGVLVGTEKWACTRRGSVAVGQPEARVSSPVV